MQRRLGLFDRLLSDLDHRLSRASTAAAVEGWRADDLVPAGCRLAAGNVVRVDAGDRRHRRAVLAAMVHLAGVDGLAGEVAYAMVLADLRRVAGQLTRVWRADREEMDQAVAIAGWDRLQRLAGRRLEWPDRVIVTGARDVVRDGLRRQSRNLGREVLAAEVDPGPAVTAGFYDAAGLIQDALRRKVVTGRQRPAGVGHAGPRGSRRGCGRRSGRASEPGGDAPAARRAGVAGRPGRRVRVGASRVMLSIGMLAAGDEGYFIELSAGHSAGREDEYYIKGGEPPGVWMGGGSPSLGLSGVVEPDDLRAVLGGYHPGSGQPLLASAVMAGRRRPGLYMTFSAPKGVSLIGLLGDQATAEEVRAAHREAVTAAVGHIEREALFARRGHQGQERIRTGGFVAAGFEHTTSRAGDPQLHTHVLVANLVEGVDGLWSTPDSRSLFRHSRTAGFVYQAVLRFELTKRLGLEWGPVKAGMAEPVGIPRQVLREFSTRRRQIEARLEATGNTGGQAAQVAATSTRAAKDHSVTAEVLRESWRVQAEAAGLDLDRIRGLCHPGRHPEPLTDRDGQLIDLLVGQTGLTGHASSFDRRDVIRATAELAGEGATAETIEAFADRVLADERVVPLTPLPHPQATEAEVAHGEKPAPGQGRWTTTELLAVEAEMIASAIGRRGSNPAPIADGHLRAAVMARPTLTGEQTAAVTAITTGREGVAVLVGRAGTGKTYALDAARDAWQQAGHVVIGAAPSARAAAELQAGSGIPSTTLARLLLDAESPGPESCLPTGGVVVVDEAGMAGTRTLHRLLTLAERYGTKVVLVGDPAQLPEIEAGGALKALAAQLDAPELTDNRRQVEAWERAALVDVREGRSGQALVVYRDHGRLVLSDTAPDAHQAMVADWWAARIEGASVAMFALRRSDVERLNLLARSAMASAGRLGHIELSFGDRLFAAGDEVVALRNDRMLGVVNGTRATVTQVDPTSHSVEITLTDGTTRILTADYLEAGHLDYGYATTLHKGQGATVDRAFLLGSDALYREAGYVGLSRGRHRNDLYIVAAPEHEDHQHTPTRNGHTDPVVELAHTMSVSRAQTLAGHTGRPGPGPATSLSVLHAPAADPTAQLSTAGIARAAEERRHALTRAALADPGEHLTALIGPPPPAGMPRARWARAADAVEAYRDRFRVDDPTGLGPTPMDARRRVEYDHARQLVDEARRHLGLDPIARDRDLGLGL